MAGPNLDSNSVFDCNSTAISDNLRSRTKQVFLSGLICCFLKKVCPFHANMSVLTSHFYIVNVGLTWVNIFLNFSLKHILWVPVRTALLIYILSKNKKIFTIFHLKIAIITSIKNRSMIAYFRRITGCCQFDVRYVLVKYSSVIISRVGPYMS